MKKLLSIIFCIFILLSITSCGVRNEYYENSIIVDEPEILSNLETGSSEESISEPEIQDDEVLFADKVIDLYLNGKWDGFPTEIDGHEVSISYRGELLVDGFLTSNSKFDCWSQHPLDLPDSFDDGLLLDNCNTIFIPGKGTYILIDETYIKYLRGEKIDLPGNPLNWKAGKGIDTDHGHAILRYCERYDKLFLITPMLQLDDGSDEPVGPCYLYIFPDYDVSEIEFIGRAQQIFCNNEVGFAYVDENGFYWEYCEEDGRYFFKH